MLALTHEPRLSTPRPYHLSKKHASSTIQTKSHMSYPTALSLLSPFTYSNTVSQLFPPLSPSVLLTIVSTSPPTPLNLNLIPPHPLASPLQIPIPLTYFPNNPLPHLTPHILNPILHFTQRMLYEPTYAVCIRYLRRAAHWYWREEGKGPRMMFLMSV
jgi:hypothetical protein